MQFFLVVVEHQLVLAKELMTNDANQHTTKHDIEVDSVVDIECICVLPAPYLEVE